MVVIDAEVQLVTVNPEVLSHLSVLEVLTIISAAGFYPNW